MHPKPFAPATSAVARRRRRASPAVGVILVVLLASTACRTSRPTATLPASSARLDGLNVQLVPDDEGREAVRFGWGATATFEARLPADTTGLTLTVRGDQCEGPPTYRVTVDGLTVVDDVASSADWTARTYAWRLLAGTHVIEVAYTNDHRAFGCDRNLHLASIELVSNPDEPVVTNAAIPSRGFVHPWGTLLLDGANRPLRLRGVNLGGWLLWEGWIWSEGFDYVGQSQMMANIAALVGQPRAETFARDVQANYVTGDDFRALASYGFNVVRVPINHDLLEDDAAPFAYKSSGWAVLDDIVARARQHGVYVVFDLHAAPCSQSLSFISDWDGSSYLWLSPTCQDRAVALWRAIAARYAGERIVAGYDLLNETVTGDEQLLDWYRRVTTAIREVDRNHTLIYEGNNLARDFGFIPSALDPNMMISAHDYPWMTLGQDLSDRVPAYVEAATRLNVPMWIGEFGQSSYDDLLRYVRTFDGTPTFAGFAQWTWKQAPGAATLQTIRHTPASKKLVGWMTNTSRPKPSAAEAEQGMADFVAAVRFVDTLPDARTRQVLTGR